MTLRENVDDELRHMLARRGYVLPDHLRLESADAVIPLILEEARGIALRHQIKPSTGAMSEGQKANLDGWNHCAETIAEALKSDNQTALTLPEERVEGGGI